MIFDWEFAKRFFFTSLLKQIGSSFLDFIYPPICLHCDHSLEEKCPVLCQECLKLLAPIDPKTRCPSCFSDEFNPKNQRVCSKCKINSSYLERVASVFDHVGPPATLVKQLKYGDKFYFSKGLGGYLAFQFINLHWPMPDVIIPMPIAPLRLIERGYNQSLLLAQSLSSILSRPVADVLSRQSGDFSQAGLNQQQRLKLKKESFALKNGIKFHDKCLLIIDDVMTTGKSLNCCAEVLFSSFPSHIYALTVCRAIE